MSKMSVCFVDSYSLVDSIRKDVKEKNSLKNIMMVPQLKAIYISVGASRFFKNSADMEKIQLAVSYIACQKAIFTKAKRSVASFDVREGMNTGVKVSMRGKKMFQFLDRLKLIYLPRIRDFKGLNPNSFNEKAYSFGLNDAALVFPEVIFKLNTYDFTFGLNITFVFNCSAKKLQQEILESYGLPFENSEIFK